MRSLPRSRSHAAATSSSPSSTSWSSSNSRKPNQPQFLPWYSLNASLTCAVMRPTTRPSRHARKYSASPWLKKALKRRLRNSRRSSFSGGTHCGWLACRPNGRSMNRFRSPPLDTDLISTPTAEAHYMQTSIDVFAKVRDHDRSELLAAAREADILPYFHLLTSPAMPVVEMEGAERIMLGSNNYLGLTGDERVMQGAEDALHRYGTGLTGSRLLNGTIPLHLELEREIAEWMGSEDAIVFTTGHQANVGTLGTLLGPQRHGDRRRRRPRVDPRRLPALARQAAPVPPQPPRQAREDAAAGAGRRRRHPRRRRRGVLDGGRHRPAERDLRAVRALRRAPDGRRGARRRRARLPRSRHGRTARRGRPRRPAHGDVLQVAWPPAAASSPARTR